MAEDIVGPMLLWSNVSWVCAVALLADCAVILIAAWLARRPPRSWALAALPVLLASWAGPCAAYERQSYEQWVAYLSTFQGVRMPPVVAEQLRVRTDAAIHTLVALGLLAVVITLLMLLLTFLFLRAWARTLVSLDTPHAAPHAILVAASKRRLWTRRRTSHDGHDETAARA